jgi:hypothetical protein
MAFQIVDDVLDVVATDEQLGKPAGHDLVEGVYTLPARSNGGVDSALGTARDQVNAATAALAPFNGSEAAEALAGAAEHLLASVVPRPDGVRLTSPPRTLLDAAAIIGPDATESAIEQVLLERRCTFGLLMRTAERLYHPLRPGAPVFQRVLMSRPQWQGEARSDLEVRFRRAIERHGLPLPLVNHHIEVEPGATVEADLVWPEWRVIGEIDHLFWHGGAAAGRRDRRRDRRLAALGWLTIRFDQWDIDQGLADAIAELADVLHDRGWRGAGSA